ncbi:hypothetical protein [Streptomyces cadmiisoli]|uniref:hypothetical protein n=1 Tax=Streptomyces cadmiisoli TaxID=2184053 RepID=UPI003D715EE5
MTDHPLSLSAARAMAFCQAFEDRDAYIAEQPWQVKMAVGFEDTVPLPGCPYCWREAREVQWHMMAHEIWTCLPECGHWFTTDRPVVVHRSGDGWFSEEEWMP